MSAFLICLLIWKWHGQMAATKKSWLSMPIRLSWFWMNGFYWNQRIQNKGISLNCSIGDARNLQRFSVPSINSRNGMISLVVMPVLWQMQSLTVLLMTVTVSTLQALMLNTIDQCVRYMVWIKHYASKLA